MLMARAGRLRRRCGRPRLGPGPGPSSKRTTLSSSRWSKTSAASSTHWPDETTGLIDDDLHVTGALETAPATCRRSRRSALGPPLPSSSGTHPPSAKARSKSRRYSIIEIGDDDVLVRRPPPSAVEAAPVMPSTTWTRLDGEARALRTMIFSVFRGLGECLRGENARTSSGRPAEARRRSARRRRT